MEENKNLNSTPEEKGEDIVIGCDEIQPEEAVEELKTEKPKKAKKPKKEKLLKNTLLAKRGSYSIALTAIVLTAVIVLNVLVGALSDRFVLEFDMTPDKENSISAENVDYIKSIKNDVDVIICSAEESYANAVASNAQQVYGLSNDGSATEYFNQTVKLINKYNAYNSNINVKFVDTQSSEFTAITSTYGTDNLEYGSIIVSTDNEDGSKRYKKLNFTDIYALEEDQTYAAYGMTMNTVVGNEIETALTGAISYVLSDIDVQVAILTGHTTTNITDSYVKLLKANNYEVDVIADAYLTKIPDKYEIIVIPDPTKDYMEEEINAISKFLENDGKYEKGMMVFTNAASPYLTDFYTFLKDWGIEIHDGVVYEPDENYHLSGDSTVLVSANTGDVEDLAEMQMCITGNNVPISAAFEENGSKTTATIVETMPDTVIAPKGVVTDWDGASGQEGKSYATLIESTHKAYDSNANEITSKISVFSSTYFLASSYNETASVSNKNLTLAMVDRAAKIEDTGIEFVPKSITNESFYESVTEASANAMRAIFMFILPLAVLAAGIVIFVKRRNA